MGNSLKNQTRIRTSQKFVFNFSYLMLINSLKKNNKEIEEEINNLNNNNDSLLFYKTTNFYFNNIPKLNAYISNLDFRKLEIEESLINDDIDEKDKELILFLISKINENGFIKDSNSDIKKEFETLKNIVILENTINKLKKKIIAVNNYGIGVSSVKDFMQFQINNLFSKNLISIEMKKILLQISEYIKLKNINTAVNKFFSLPKNKNLENKEEIINTFFSLKRFPINKEEYMLNDKIDKDNLLLDKNYVDYFVKMRGFNEIEFKLNENNNIEKLDNVIKKTKNEITKLKDEKKSEEYEKYMKNKLEFLKKLKDTLSKRSEKLSTIIKEIVLYQIKYIISGDEKDLVPLIYADIAEKLKLPKSTISRVVSNKLIQTDFGIFPLKNLFIRNVNKNKDVSILKIMDIIKEIIEKNKNISDSKIVEILESKNVYIARRTVCTYRKKLGIKCSYIRKLLK